MQDNIAQHATLNDDILDNIPQYDTLKDDMSDPSAVRPPLPHLNKKNVKICIESMCFS